MSYLALFRRWLLVVCIPAWAIVVASAAQASHGAWQWLQEKRGVRLWKLEVPGQELPGFRGQTLVRGSIEQIAGELLDAPHLTEWMHRCAESWIYERTGEWRGVLYNRTSSAPWPVWDRDVVLDVVFDYNADHTALTVHFKNVADKLRPVPERVVRMPRLVGFYKMTQLAPDQTSVIYQVEVDIGGAIPAWIADEVAEDMPYYTLLSLRERVEDLNSRPSASAPRPLALELPIHRPGRLQAARP
jgi:hypothetical protein